EEDCSVRFRKEVRQKLGGGEEVLDDWATTAGVIKETARKVLSVTSGNRKEVCVARWNSQTCRDTLLTQDLVHGEGPNISMGDTVEVALSSCLLQNHAMEQGWEKGMLGMQKGGRRLIIVSPSMGYDSNGGPSCATHFSTLFAVEVLQPHSSHLQPFTLTFPPQHTPYPSDVGSYMISESQQHNTEIRLAVAKVIDKVDCLASKMRLVKELDVSSSCVCKLQQKVDSLQQRVTELQTELSAILQESQSRCALISCLESNVEELKREIVQSRQQWREEKQKCRKMKWIMTNTEEEIQDLKEENKSLNQNSNLQKELAREKRQINAQLAEQVKLVMNGLFRSLRGEFNLQETYPGESVLTIVLNTIKQVTLQFLKELESEEDDEKYVTAEEKTRGRIKHGKKSEKMESPQSLDHTYTTAYETNSLEASEVSSDSFREATGEVKVKGLKEFHSTD
ncbi:FK506-binding protein 15 isoform X4, partial [Silurus asotus]